jgi:hypothetical protein
MSSTRVAQIVTELSKSKGSVTGLNCPRIQRASQGRAEKSNINYALQHTLCITPCIHVGGTTTGGHMPVWQPFHNLNMTQSHYELVYADTPTAQRFLRASAGLCDSHQVRLHRPHQTAQVA